MGTTDIALERIFKRLTKGNVGMAIEETDTFLKAWPNPQTQERLNTLREEYALMEGYWRQGMKDPQQQEQYLRLLQRVYVLCANIAIHRHIAASSFLQGISNMVRQSGTHWSLESIRKEMVDFVTEVAMLELEPEGVRDEKRNTVYRKHKQQMNALFNYIVTSRIWTDNVGSVMQELLLSPMVDSNDQQLLVSAVTLSLMNRFDMVKFRLLTEVYQQSQDESVRQRALVGWVMGIDDDFLEVYPEQQKLVHAMLQSKRACRELTELQMQLVYTLNAEKDSSTIRQEIMPDIIKNNNFRITAHGLEEKEDDALEDILNPDAAELRMEKLESTFQRMQDMRAQGVDIFFGGFSQMKRFPFFYDMSNWLVPFFLQHPDIAQFLKGMEGNRFVNWLTNQGPFCNSDKYSFMIALKDVMEQLPESVRNLLNNGEVPMMEMDDVQQQSPAYIRRLYLMDLYRFFRLFPNRSALYNPFDTKKGGCGELGGCLFFSSRLFVGSPLDGYKREVVPMLLKHHQQEAADWLLLSFPETMHDVQYFLWRKDYDKALQMDPDNERALAGHAREAFRLMHYDEAEQDYDRLLLMHSGNPNYMLNKAICLLKMSDGGQVEEAMQLLYQLNYEHPENISFLRALSWGLTCDGKLEQADKNYQQLVACDDALDEDFLNHGYCLWLLGRKDAAAASFRRYRELSGDTREPIFFSETALLQAYGISELDMKMMETLILKGAGS